jgi:hypothetical protein
MHARVSRVIELGDKFLEAASATDAFIGAFSWQPLFCGVMIRTTIVRNAGYVTFQLAGVTIPRKLFREILRWIARLRMACLY